MTSRRKGVANVDLWTQVHLPARCQVLHVPAQDVIPGYSIKQRNILRDAIRSTITTTPYSTVTPEVPVPVAQTIRDTDGGTDATTNVNSVFYCTIA